LRLLAVDVGNTRTKFGLFSFGSECRSPLPDCEQFLAVPHGDAIPWETLAEWMPLATEGCPVALAGSDPGRIAALQEAFRQRGWSSPWRLSDRTAMPLAIDVDAPDKVGVDRLLNAVAANLLRPADRAAIVIDTGTAATVDFISSDGRFCGGAILPGFALSAQALHTYTALLPRLTVRELANEPPVPVGRNTSDAIRSGVYWGHAGALKELVAQICGQHSLPIPRWDQPQDDSAAPWLLLTGGGAPFLAPVFPTIRQMPSLALYGLAVVARRRCVQGTLS
jgi:type III pantothenate kinase